MRKFTKTFDRVITNEEQWYGCDVCKFESKSKDDVRSHTANEHSYTKHANHKQCLFFETKEAAELYLSQYQYYNRSVDFTGPGWYFLEDEWDHYDDCNSWHLWPIEKKIEDLRLQMNQIETQIFKLKELK